MQPEIDLADRMKIDAILNLIAKDEILAGQFALSLGEPAGDFACWLDNIKVVTR